MRVLIFTEAGKKVGLGHISRCSSLYCAAISKKVESELIVNGDLSEFGGLKLKNVNWMQNDYINNNVTKDDYVIIDSYKASFDLYKMIEKKSKKVMFIDDIGRVKYPKGIILNPSLDASHIDYSYFQNKILSGPEYVILRDAFKPISGRIHNNKVKNILVVMGGSDIRNLSEYIIENICVNYKDINFNIVLGTSNLLSFDEKKSKNIKIFKGLDSNQMKDLMIKSDLCLTAAGQTVYELIATDTPFIAIKVIDNQDNNVKSLVKYNPDQIVIDYNDGDILQKLLESINYQQCIENRLNSIENYRNLLDGGASDRIIIEFLKEDL